METVDKYKAQKKHLRKNYVRFSVDYRPEELDRFKAACKKNGTTPTAEIKKFIAEYCEKQAGE
jgi:hypothetical protein